MRRLLIVMPLLLTCGLLWAQSPVDSTQKLIETPIFVIPAGPVAGSFTSAARLTVVDTIAGWAQVRVEGWVPIGAVQDRLTATPPASIVTPAKPPSVAASPEKPKAVTQQCAATTTKGKRCKRNAVKGSNYCWQHQR